MSKSEQNSILELQKTYHCTLKQRSCQYLATILQFLEIWRLCPEITYKGSAPGFLWGSVSDVDFFEYLRYYYSLLVYNVGLCEFFLSFMYYYCWVTVSAMLVTCCPAVILFYEHCTECFGVNITNKINTYYGVLFCTEAQSDTNNNI